jgi:hypothetical protein
MMIFGECIGMVVLVSQKDLGGINALMPSHLQKKSLIAGKKLSSVGGPSLMDVFCVTAQEIRSNFLCFSYSSTLPHECSIPCFPP